MSSMFDNVVVAVIVVVVVIIVVVVAVITIASTNTTTKEQSCRANQGISLSVLATKFGHEIASVAAT